MRWMLGAPRDISQQDYSVFGIACRHDAIAVHAVVVEDLIDARDIFCKINKLIQNVMCLVDSANGKMKPNETIVCPTLLGR